MSVSLVLGVDAGGTKTDALVAGPDGGVLAWVRGPGTNHESVGWAATKARLGATLAEVLEVAGAGPETVVASAWGMAGLDWPADEIRHRKIIAGLDMGGPTTVVNDAFLALEVDTEAASGVAVVSGTGVVVVGRGPDGRVARTLGVGAGRGEWGSGGDVVRAAAEAVAQQHMGLGPCTALTERALQRAKARSVGAYCEEVWRHGRTHLLPPDVWDAAAADDAVAAAIADRAADSLAAGVGAVARRLDLRRCEVVLAGRLLDPGHPVLHARLVSALAREVPDCQPRRLGVAPVVGAVLAAGRSAGWNMSALNDVPPALLSGDDPLVGRVDVRVQRAESVGVQWSEE